MDVFSFLAQGFAVALLPKMLLLAFIGCTLGTVIGSLPGLGPVNGVALLIPLTFNFNLGATGALILLVGVYYGAMYGGRISSIILNIPGDEPAMMTTLDGHPMGLKGRGGEALALTAVASFVGGTIATIGLTLLAPPLVHFAINFGPAEYFALYALAFATIGGVTGGSLNKGLIAAGIGLLLGTVGIDPVSSVPRYVFGYIHLYSGFNFVVAMVGLFAISECLMFWRNPQTVASRWSKSVRLSQASNVHLGVTGLLGAARLLGSFPVYCQAQERR